MADELLQAACQLAERVRAHDEHALYIVLYAILKPHGGRFEFPLADLAPYVDHAGQIEQRFDLTVREDSIVVETSIAISEPAPEREPTEAERVMAEMLRARKRAMN